MNMTYAENEKNTAETKTRRTHAGLPVYVVNFRKVYALLPSPLDRRDGVCENFKRSCFEMWADDMP